MITAAFIVLSLGVVGAARTDAQAGHTAHDCSKAARIVARGHPVKKEDWAWSMLLVCGAQDSEAAHDAWLQQRSVSDTVQLEATYARLWSFRDAGLFDAAASIAADAAATPQSRVYSMMMLLAQLLDDTYPTYDFFISTGPFDVCRQSSVADRTIAVGTPLPSSDRQRARTLAKSLAADESAPAIVRSAGRCLDQALWIDDQVQAAKPIRPPSRQPAAPLGPRRSGSDTTRAGNQS